jgi:hypothetical protein
LKGKRGRNEFCAAVTRRHANRKRGRSEFRAVGSLRRLEPRRAHDIADILAETFGVDFHQEHEQESDEPGGLTGAIPGPRLTLLVLRAEPTIFP